MYSDTPPKTVFFLSLSHTLSHSPSSPSSPSSHSPLLLLLLPLSLFSFPKESLSHCVSAIMSGMAYMEVAVSLSLSLSLRLRLGAVVALFSEREDPGWSLGQEVRTRGRTAALITTGRDDPQNTKGSTISGLRSKYASKRSQDLPFLLSDEIDRTEIVEGEGSTCCDFAVTLFVPCHDLNRRVWLCVYDVHEDEPEDLAQAHAIGTVCVKVRDLLSSPVVRKQLDDISTTRVSPGSISLTRLSAECCSSRRMQTVRAWNPSTSYAVSGYLFRSHRDLHCHEHMAESPFAFGVPALLLAQILPHRLAQLHALEWDAAELAAELSREDAHGLFRDRQVGTAARLVSSLRSDLLEHIDAIKKGMSAYLSYDLPTSSLPSFKPSTSKLDPLLRFVPTNLHIQQFRVYSSKATLAAAYDHVTFGAPAAFLRRFEKGKGLRYYVRLKERLTGLCAWTSLILLSCLVLTS
jgi:hypothetical protein